MEVLQQLWTYYAQNGGYVLGNFTATFNVGIRRIVRRRRRHPGRHFHRQIP